MGSQRELINIRGAQLYLIDGEETVIMQSGDFSLKLLKQTHSPLAVVVANVGEVQWPVGKDAPALKVFHRRYTFALPGLVYGMILPESTSAEILQQLEIILAEYSTFETHHEIANSVQNQSTSSGVRDNAGYWTAVAPDVETLSSRVARQISSTSTVVANSIVKGGDWAASGIKHGASLLKRKGPDSSGSGEGRVSPRMMKRMQQARRMSAVAKLMSRTLLKGAISATGHVSKNLGLDVNATTSGSQYGSQEDTARNVAVASVDAFGKVVEAVETAGKSLMDATQTAGTDMVQERFGEQAGQVLQDGLGAVGNVINTAWTLNKMGVRMLLRMTAASTALNTRSGSKSTSTTGDESMSSPTSTASMPMRHRSPPPLQHQITLSPQHSADPVPLDLLPNASVHSGQTLHTSQLFPTSAEQMRDQSVIGLPAPSPMFVPVGNYTSVIPIGTPANSPFQKYHRHVPQPQPPFSFQPRANTKME
ncbi:senescence/dehydration-associated protein At4g35985, chloroplastic [Physcomitrium patens]|uniref:Senescence domain-containing protein n=1 Tax=Physcomitrium patens TaxID=3218 RepID=A0A2K1KJW3_PHYPA|nr:senescence/dehydration-associated protein At4g35985, chloroplastic-like [Physcomitrium patens]XP_024375083.1 senescence/dehydration-associated protein At4g35985, chloroplastic-like [Physcomitrium patens]XP_024375084.1 senescence/dehydration-associated protein At4g35985, chloroplastic-like [Physcomitrium patens]PNR54068.1 hypothetical protein PHYPA_007744 [Physcomitrium patens]|eukprot:XP_024375082.1 senescence/dehydration-associated protein At4g35985, chloroplastic-like [Physcomitrella patens]